MTQSQIHYGIDQKFRKQFTPYDLVVSEKGHGVVWQNKVRTAVLELRKAGLIHILTGVLWRDTKDKFWGLTSVGDRTLKNKLPIVRKSRCDKFSSGDMVRVQRLLGNSDDGMHVFLGRSGMVIGRRGSLYDVKFMSLDRSALFNPEELVPV